MAKKKKSNIQVNTEFYLALPLIKLIQILPLKLVYSLAFILSKLFYVISRKHRVRTIQHLIHAGVVKNNKEAKAMAKVVFYNMTKLALEIFKLKSVLNRDNVHEFLNITGSQKAKEMFFSDDFGHQMIIATAHYGNWEVLSTGFKCLFKRPVTAVMRMFDNPKLGELIYDERVLSGDSTMIPKKGGIRHLMKALRNDETVCLLVDQHAGRTDGVETIFFGQPARTHSSLALLHLKTGVPILPFVSKRVDNQGHFDIVCSDPIIYTPTDDKGDDIQKLTQMVTTALEGLIRECPEQWMWCHRRWLNINRKGYTKER